MITALPIRGKQAQLAAQIEDRHAMAKRALGYVELYGAYTETDARYRVDRLLELWDSCDGTTGRTSASIPAAIDWDHYVYDVHLPSVVEHARVRTKPGKSVVDKRPERQRAGHPVARPASGRVRPGAHAASPRTSSTPTPGWPAATSRRRRGHASWPTWSARHPACWPSTAVTGATSSARSTGASKARRSPSCGTDSWELFHRQLLTRSFPDGFARVRAHRALGHRTLLITGALDFVIEPIRPLFDDIVCAQMDARDGRLTGRLTTLPPIGEARALLLSRLRRTTRALPRGVGGLRRLGQRPGHARGGRVPRRRQPRVAPGRHRPAPRLARGALGQGEGRLAPAAAAGPFDVEDRPKR